MGSFETEAKVTKDFIRLIKKHPLQIKMLSNVPTGMYILPVMFTLAVNYLIILLQFNHGMSRFEEFKPIIFILISYMTLTILPILAGHKIYRQDSYGPDAKLLKDFIRLTKKKPLQIKLITKIPVGLYLLPVLFAIAINYVITMLQFNHVI
ncbi:hypothetical protein HW555_008853 [Spodoptera exigua]|uniref:Uncharacterized protein n=1 Tax=Spodoptera exigua TaxID=7107 RepID=A0A835L325_SPOEX|nr:hypothetical protein HW555_008853 [Spodoptera exigua]